MSKKQITGEDGKVYTVKENKPWYKKWWLWIIIGILVIILIFNAIGNSSSDSKGDSKAEKVSTTNTKTDSSKASTATGKQVKLSDDTFTVDKEKDYDPAWSDNSWAGTSASIDKIRVIKVKPQEYYDGKDKYKPAGIILVHYKVTATRDIHFYPAQGTLITSDGQQEDADMNNSDDFDGDIAKGVSKDGNVVYIIKNMTSPDQFKTLRLKWHADYETDDYDDDNSSKDYDITVNLNK